MTRKDAGKHPIRLLRESVNTLIANPIILLPFITIAFIHLLALEILYFAPRFPLSQFFGPIIASLYGEIYLHYPHSLVLLPKLFYKAQILIYLFLSGFLFSVAIAIIAALNNHQKISFKAASRIALSQYVHIFLGATLVLGTFYCLYYKLYGLLIARALQIKSVTGLFFNIKTIVLQGAPYFNLLIGIFVTALFAFVLPIIIIEKKKIFSAIILNFKNLWKSCWFIFFVVFIPTLFYLPVLLIRNNVSAIAKTSFPDIHVLVLILSVLVMVAIDATVYTAITTYYLFKKESR